MLKKLSNQVKRSGRTYKQPAKTVVTKVLESIKEPIAITDSWGMRFIHYPTDSESLEVMTSKDFYKPELLAMRLLVGGGDTVIDVGANIGLFSVFLSREVGPKGRLYAFEPALNNYWRMLENLTLNRCMNVTPFQQAISNKQGLATMNIFPEGYGAWNTFGKPVFGKVKSVAKEKVRIVTLDGFCEKNNLKKIKFLKLDVEGYEFDALEGARELLATNRIKYISFEISEIPLKGAGRTAKQIFNLLRSYEYRAYEFDPETDRFKGPIESSDSFYQNFYASRSDMRKL